jgi:hypothetical protein
MAGARFPLAHSPNGSVPFWTLQYCLNLSQKHCIWSIILFIWAIQFKCTNPLHTPAFRHIRMTRLHPPLVNSHFHPFLDPSYTFMPRVSTTFLHAMQTQRTQHSLFILSCPSLWAALSVLDLCVGFDLGTNQVSLWRDSGDVSPIILPVS